MRTTAKHIGNQGKSLIHVAKTQLNMTDDDYRALLRRQGGVTSSRDLNEAGLSAVMAEFKRLGFVATKSSRKPASAGGTGPNSPTAAQWRLIEERARQVGYSGLADPRFIAWVKPRGKVDHPRFLDRDGARRVIAALGNWIERETTKKEQGK